MKKETLLKAVIAFGFIGLIAATYTSYAHFDASAYDVCSFGESFSCDIVNQSEYAKVAGIPVAFLGFGAYIFYLVFGFYSLKKHNDTLLMLASAGAVAGLMFSLYLTGIEAFVLYTWCLFCIISQLAMLGIAISVLWYRQLVLKESV